MTLRVLHLPTTVGGNPNGLSAALRRLGVDSELWTIDQNVFAYPADRVLTEPTDHRLIRILKQVRALSYVFGDWDVIHFNSGRSLFSTRFVERDGSWRDLARVGANALLGLMQRCELGILRLRKIPFFVHYQGDDARQGARSLELFEESIAAHVPADYYPESLDRWKRQQIRLLTPHAAGVYAVNPDLLHFLPPGTTFVPYGHVDLADWVPVTPAPHTTVRVVHAPSHRAVKGSDRIIDACEQLRADGIDLELILVEGLSNREARAVYAQADIVIDQLYGGWYGGFALEVMALGKPVAAYIRENDLEFIDPDMRAELPIVRVQAGTLVDDLRAFVTLSADERSALGARSRSFVERWHDPNAIAMRILNDYEAALSGRGRKRFLSRNSGPSNQR